MDFTNIALRHCMSGEIECWYPKGKFPLIDSVLRSNDVPETDTPTFNNWILEGDSQKCVARRATWEYGWFCGTEAQVADKICAYYERYNK